MISGARAGAAMLLDLGGWADFAGGEVSHEEEEEGIAGDVKIKIH